MPTYMQNFRHEQFWFMPARKSARHGKFQEKEKKNSDYWTEYIPFDFLTEKVRKPTMLSLKWDLHSWKLFIITLVENSQPVFFDSNDSWNRDESLPFAILPPPDHRAVDLKYNSQEIFMIFWCYFNAVDIDADERNSANNFLAQWFSFLIRICANCIFCHFQAIKIPMQLKKSKGV